MVIHPTTAAGFRMHIRCRAVGGRALKRDRGGAGGGGGGGGGGVGAGGPPPRPPLWRPLISGGGLG
ncbi:hypothetical protein [Nocardia cyriacigeorgica]|uniref:hypothetical protein n=1 Tax=Nocardia cyriacigeorgica TaxID=135487 RepID=UPI0024549BAB|nr:hypothetical protein [Nocardia cyriacigeorgica]